MPENQTSPTQPSQQITKDLKKSNISHLFTNKKKLIFLLFGLIFFLLATSALTLRKPQTQPSSPTSQLEVTPTPGRYLTCDPGFILICEGGDCECMQDDTSSWKTYRNEEYGFEVSYPKDWQFKEIGTSPNSSARTSFKISAVESNSNDPTSYSKDLSYFEIVPSIGGRGDYMFGHEIKRKEFKTTTFTGTRRDYFAKNGTMFASVIIIDPNEKRPKWPDAIIDLVPEITDSKWQDVYLEEINDYTRNLASREVNEQDYKTLNQILSTFEFLE